MARPTQGAAEVSLLCWGTHATTPRALTLWIAMIALPLAVRLLIASYGLGRLTVTLAQGCDLPPRVPTTHGPLPKGELAEHNVLFWTPKLLM